MQTYVLLFRGINVGGKNRLPMKPLVELLTRFGAAKVQTYIQSGNVVLDAHDKPGARLSAEIGSEFGFTPEFLALPAEVFLQVLESNPMPSDRGKEVHFYFCASAPTVDQDLIERYRAESEQLEILGCVAYLHAPEGIGRSKLAANLERCLGVAATGRNLNTIHKLSALLEER